MPNQQQSKLFLSCLGQKTNPISLMLEITGCFGCLSVQDVPARLCRVKHSMGRPATSLRPDIDRGRVGRLGCVAIPATRAWSCVQSSIWSCYVPIAHLIWTQPYVREKILDVVWSPSVSLLTAISKVLIIVISSLLAANKGSPEAPRLHVGFDYCTTTV